MPCSVVLLRRADGLVAKGENPKQGLDDRQKTPPTNDQDTKSVAGQSVSILRPATAGAVESIGERDGCAAARATDHAESRAEHQQDGGNTPRTKFTGTTRVKMCVWC